MLLFRNVYKVKKNSWLHACGKLFQRDPERFTTLPVPALIKAFVTVF